ncbi:MAG: hypothetical protein STSR0008_07860 [Ignavibacterium sp.]
MQNQIIEIVSKILDGITTNNYSLDEVEKILLKNKKYNRSTVATAYSWIYDKLFSNTIKTKNTEEIKKSFRLLSNEEIEMIGLENYNHLLKLYNVGLLLDEDLDLVIDQLLIYPDILSNKISTDEINILILSSLFLIDTNTLPGSRMLLYLSDKIN